MLKKIILVCSFLIFSNFLFGASAYNQFAKAYRSKNYTQALDYIQKAYQEKPESPKIIWWYGVALYKNGKYRRAIQIIEKHPNPESAHLHYIANCYLKLNQPSKALRVLNGLFDSVDPKQKWRSYLVTKWLKLLKKHGSIEDFLPHEKKFSNYIENYRPKHRDWQVYSVAKLFYDAGQKLYINHPAKSLSYLNKANSILSRGVGKYSKYLNEHRVAFYSNALGFWIKNHKKSRTELHHKFLVTVYENVDATWIDKFGKKQAQKNRFDKNLLSEFEREMKILGRLIFYLTKGKVKVSHKIETNPATITEFQYNLWEAKQKGRNGKSLQQVDVLSPVTNTIRPHPGKNFLSKINQYDTFIRVFPSEGITKICTGGMTRPKFVPYFLSSKKLRGNITMASQSFRAKTLLHEFFHNIQVAYKKDEAFISHVWRYSKKLWPSWYRGKGELAYYKNAFDKIIVPTGVSKLSFKNQKDTTSMEDFNRTYSLFKKYTLDDLKQVQEWNQKAWQCYSKKQRALARRYFEKIYRHIPNFPRVNAMLGFLYYKARKIQKAITHYQNAINEKPDAGLYNMLAFLLTKEKNFDKAKEAYIKAYELKAKPSYAYMIANSDYRNKNYVEAVLAFTRYLKKHLDHKNSAAALNLSLYMLNYKIKDHQRALIMGKNLAKKVKGSERTLGSIQFYLGYAYYKKGEQAAAKKHFLQARNLGYKAKTINYYLKRVNYR